MAKNWKRLTFKFLQFTSDFKKFSMFLIVFTVFVVALYFVFWFQELRVAKLLLIGSERSDSGDVLDALRSLNVLRNKGVLLTPSEYTSNLADYYNTIISVLLGAFVLFGVFTYFQLRVTVRRDIESHLNDYIENSLEFRERLKKSVTVNFDENYVSYDVFLNIFGKEASQDNLKQLFTDVQLLKEELQDLKDKQKEGGK